jgi:hypothetical protein
MADVSLDGLVIPDWLGMATKSQLTRDLRSPVHRERWKYTPAQKIIGLITPRTQDPVLSGVDQHGVVVAPRQDRKIGDIICADPTPEAFMATCDANVVLDIEVTESLADPITINYDAASPPVLLRIGRGVACEVREVFRANEKATHLLWVELAEDASVVHSRLSFETSGSHWQFLHVNQGTRSEYVLHNHSVGAELRRQDVQANLAGEGARFMLESAACIAGRRHLDQQLTVQHLVGGTESRQRIHNIAANGASVTCNGRIHIHENAPKSSADLTNRNLALGSSATVNTKPELEIYTDDVTCSHGATVGQLSDDEIFYCVSRGIAPAEARKLLSTGFLLECVNGACRDTSTQALTSALAEAALE